MTRARQLGVIFITFVLAAVESSASSVQLSCKPTFTPSSGSYDFIKANESVYAVKPGSTLGQIHITRLPIFDEDNPKENRGIFRWANRFHVLTRQRTVERDLLIDSGDPYDERVIAEAGRILRQAHYLYDADVRPVSQCGDIVDVEVITRDVWSFIPEVSYDRSGGDSTVRFGIAETNLFGSGRSLSFAAKNDQERTSKSFGYRDRNVAGRRVDARLLYTDSDDGFHEYARLALPFYALDSRNAWSASVERLKEDDTQYFRGNKVTSVRHDVHESILTYGISDGLLAGTAKRWRFGLVARRDRFSPTIGLPPPAVFPVDKKLVYPFIEYSSIEDDFITTSNIDQIHRTEDLHLGLTVVASLGFAATAFGSDRDRLVYKGRLEDTLSVNERDLLQHELSVSGLWNFDSRHSEDVIAAYRIRYFRSQTTHRSFFASIDATWTKNLNTNQQVTLGGENGARAFDNHFQAGDRSYLLTLEERQYTNIHLLNLVRLGFATFVDIGRAWEPGQDDGLTDALLANFGLGLRLASSKANVGKIIHIDFAFPLTNRDDPAIDGWQIAVKIKDSF